MKKDTDHDARNEDASPPPDVQAWLDSLSEEERVAMAQTWSLTRLARGAMAGDEAVEAASARLWDAIEAREALPHRPTDRPGLPGARARRRRSFAQVLVALLLVGGSVALGWMLGSRTPDVAGSGEELAEFMILLRGGDFEGRSPSEQRRIVAEFSAWAEVLSREGRFLAGDELADEGRVLVQEEGQVLERAFTLSSEGIGGYFIIAARDYDEAVAIASGCPQLDHGGAVELRQVVRR